MWMRIVGKVKLALVPFLNVWWKVPFSVTARGLTTSAIPFGRQIFQAPPGGQRSGKAPFSAGERAGLDVATSYDQPRDSGRGAFGSFARGGHDPGRGVQRLGDGGDHHDHGVRV